VTVIDPCIDANLQEKYHALKNVSVRKGLSLEVLPKLTEQFDCILIDGDHNWYTVFNELRLIEERNLLRNGGAIFLHDVSWPYGRRDMYYDLKNVPAEFTQPNAKKGIIRGESKLSDTEGINNIVYNALVEGGPRNGVLTAVEDFMNLHSCKYQYLSSDREVGLGMLFKGGVFGKLRMARWVRRFKSVN